MSNQITFGNVTYDIDVNVRTERVKGFRPGKSVIYVDGNPAPADYMAEWAPAQMAALNAERATKGSKLWKSYNKAEVKTMTEALEAVRTEIFQKIANLHANTNKPGRSAEDIEKTVNRVRQSLSGAKFYFQRTAGCSCGCSPGFRIIWASGGMADLGNGLSWSGTNVTVSVRLSTAQSRETDRVNAARSAVRSAEYQIKILNKKLEEAVAQVAKLRTQRSAADKVLYDAQSALDKIESSVVVK